MGSGCTNGNENVYFRARKVASEYNERLCSREGAAELLGVSPSTLADYELGITKVVPVDKVVLMADLYNCPELKAGYCKKECPIGKLLPLATESKGLEGTVLRYLDAIDVEEIDKVSKMLVRIAKDGVVSKSEATDLIAIMRKLNSFSYAISEMRLVAEKLGINDAGGG